MRSMIIPAALAVGFAAVAAAPAAAFAPAGPALTAATGSATPVNYRYRHRARTYAPYAYAREGWVPYSKRGFEDPGFAYHGNINGCAVDLGYGRWESCDKGR
jgi:hypothetical protein